MRVLVIGGTGFMGPAVVSALHRRGHRVAVMHRGRTNPALPREVEHITGERRSMGDAAAAFARFAPDVVIDMILSSKRQARATMDAFRGLAGRVVVASSMDVYRACGILHGREPGEPDDAPLTEDAPLRTVFNPYPPEAMRRIQTAFPWVDEDYDKIPVVRAMMSDPALPGTVLRLPMVYGPGDPLHRLFPILKRVDDGRPAILLEETAARWRGPRGYVENVGAAIALAATDARAAGRIYNVADPESLTELEWTRRVAAAASFTGRIEVLPADGTPAHLRFPGDARQHWVPVTRRIREELGYAEPVPADEALRRTVAWERANPPAGIDPAQFDYAAEDAAFK